MVHIEKSQKVPQNENLIVFSPSGDYDEDQLIECCEINNPSVAIGAYQAQFIKYGGVVYRFNDEEELGAELVKLDPSSSHRAVAFYKEGQRRKNRGGVSIVDPQQNSIVSSEGSQCLADYDLSTYAADPMHVQKISIILSSMDPMTSVASIDVYLGQVVIGCPLTGLMIFNAASEYNVDCRLLMAIMELESRFGTLGVAVETLNPGNVGNTGTATRTYSSWQAGVNAVANWLDKHRVKDKAIVAEEPTQPIDRPIVEEPTPVVENPVVEEPVVTPPEEVVPEIPPVENPTSTEPIIRPEEPIKLPSTEEPVSPDIAPVSKAKNKSGKLLAKLTKSNKKINSKNRA